MDRLQQDKEEEEQRWKEDKIRLAKNALILLSVLVVAAVPVVWCSAGQPVLVVWRFSLLLCCSFLSSRLLDDGDETVSARTMFLVLFSGFMAALFADAVLDPKIGVLIAHLNSHLAAGMLGYALAGHRQRNGLEVTPAAAPPLKKLSEKEEDDMFCFRIFACIVFSLVTILIAAGVAWELLWEWDWENGPTEYLVLLVFGPTSYALQWWPIFLGALLRGAFIGETGINFLSVHPILVGVFHLLSLLVLGDTGAMIVTWLGILFWTRFFGYTLCVYSSFRLEEARTRAAAKQSEVDKTTIATLAVDSDVRSSEEVAKTIAT